jgi:transposase InsO family protein
VGARHHLRPDAPGFVYFVAVMDWATRRILAHRLSNTLTADFCVEALDEGITRYVTFYNQRWPHRALNGAMPDSAYFATRELKAAA